MTSRALWLALAVAALAALAGCQPVDDGLALDAVQSAAPAVEALEASQPHRLPQTLAQLLERAAPEAADWRESGHLAEIAIGLHGDRQWGEVRMTYLRAEEDRLLTVNLDSLGVEWEQPTLETLGLEEISEEALSDFPPLPADAAEPAWLAEAARPLLDECGETDAVTEVLYVTGAPATWDGTRWTQPPVWKATVLAGGGGVVVDPVTGAGADDRCLEVAAPSQ